ncbi:MAG: Rne/Rng family ribonuclease [Bdellovibrionales bacterium]|nr:Rne/Rng family ribonuclease [Bdellovibrionales bacterium]
MAKELIINASLPEIRIALMEDGQIQELLIERDSDKGIVGNIYKGRVTRVLPGMQAAFVDIGLDKAAFLYVDDIYVHPKVMGEETEVAGDDESEGAPIQAFDGGASDEILPEGGDIVQGSEQSVGETSAESPKVIESLDSSMLESHASEHFEREESAFSTDTEEDEETNPMIAAPLSVDFDDSDGDDDEGSDEQDDDELSAGADEGDDMDDEGEDDEGLELSEEGAEVATNDAGGESITDAEGNEITAGAVGEGTAEGTDGAPLAGLNNPRGPRRGRNRRRGRRGRGRDGNRPNQFAGGESYVDPNLMPESVNQSLDEQGNVVSDRAQMEGESGPRTGRGRQGPQRQRPEFREQRGRDRRIKGKQSRPRAPASIADMLKEGQEVIVQVAKDPIATKGARLTCHVSLPGRHLVCMPTIDHVGVSRRIERDDERRRLRDFVEKNRPRKMGFIVRTASGGKDPESWIKQDIDYLSKLWKEIRTKTDDVSAPALVYEDLNSILRAIRDWVNEDIDKIIVDSRYYYNELMAFSERFMPGLAEIIELYQGDIPIFDAYGISGELHRSLERRVWLKSGGYIVIDQAEALVAIDVNTGRFVGKKSLEDTILKTNLEAAEEIAYQLRLRNCGGIIICDFIDMERDDNRMRVYRALDEALKRDRARPTIQKISDLGLVEMTRKRTRDTIIRTLCEPCATCEGKGFSKSPRTVAYEILREMERLSVDREAKKILVSAHESVIDILAIDLRDVLDQLERRYNKSVYLQAVADFHSEQFEAVTDRDGGKKNTGDIARQLRVERERTERKEKSKRHRDEDRNRNRDRDGGGDDETRESRGRGGRDRNRNRNRNREDRGDRDQKQNQNVGGEEGGEPRPSLFKVNPRPQQTQNADGESAGNAGGGDEDQQQFMEGDAAPALPQQTQANYDDAQPDEDQLAYLRAQAAQDAALANIGGNSPQVPPGQNRGGGRNQNNRNNNQGGGRGGRNDRNNRGRHDRGGRGNNQQHSGQRFRPGQGGGLIQPRPIAAQNAAPTPQSTYSEPQSEPAQVPDYEVLSRNDGGGNDSSNT